MSDDVTQMLRACSAGDRQAMERLLPLVYQELRRMARARMAHERAEHTLQPTALVHEAYLRLVGGGNDVHFAARGHFFTAAAEAMRRILIEHARKKNALKSGGERLRVALDDDLLSAISLPCTDPGELLALDEALDRLAAHDPNKAQLVQLLFFAGLSFDEASAAMALSKTTAHREWVFARAWLRDAVAGRGG